MVMKNGQNTFQKRNYNLEFGKTTICSSINTISQLKQVATITKYANHRKKSRNLLEKSTQPSDTIVIHMNNVIRQITKMKHSVLQVHASLSFSCLLFDCYSKHSSIRNLRVTITNSHFYILIQITCFKCLRCRCSFESEPLYHIS